MSSCAVVLNNKITALLWQIVALILINKHSVSLCDRRYSSVDKQRECLVSLSSCSVACFVQVSKSIQRTISCPFEKKCKIIIFFLTLCWSLYLLGEPIPFNHKKQECLRL